MSNSLRAFFNIVTNYHSGIENVTQGNNRANNMGEGLENFIKDAFAGTFAVDDLQERLVKQSEVFSYEGNKNNPPDLILKNGDAIEIKKIESKNSALALNSSYPKAKLYVDNPMLTKACRECENWQEKDMLYVIGQIPKKSKSLKSLWFIYGDCYCASREVYERIRQTISSGIMLIPDVEFTQTNELGKVKKVDPLGITDLRIRGMWHIENPNKTFHYVYQYDDESDFQCMFIVRKEKFDAITEEDTAILELFEEKNIVVKNIKIKNPDNPAKLLDAVLLAYKV